MTDDSFLTPGWQGPSITRQAELKPPSTNEGSNCPFSGMAEREYVYHWPSAYQQFAGDRCDQGLRKRTVNRHGTVRPECRTRGVADEVLPAVDFAMPHRPVGFLTAIGCISGLLKKS